MELCITIILFLEILLVFISLSREIEEKVYLMHFVKPYCPRK
jgi:hypothetical protein